MSNFIATSSVIFCDVVTGMDFQDFPVALRLDSSLAQVIIGLEQELLDPSRRSSVEELKRLLHPWFREVGASGRNYDRESIIAQLAMEPIRQSGPVKVANPVALQLAGHLVLLRWHLHAEVSSERSSLWILEQDRWQMIFHQGTTSSAQIPASTPKAEAAASAGDEFCVRPLEPSDAAAVFEAFSSNPDMKRQGDADTLQKAHAYVQALLEDRKRQRALAVTIEDRLVGLVCGTVDQPNENAWVWYWMNQKYRGRSLATRAVASLVDYLFGELGLYRLELGLRANNPSSKHVAESNGFLREGIERGKFLVDGNRIDVYTYARLRTDPAPAVNALPWSRQP